MMQLGKIRRVLLTCPERAAVRSRVSPANVARVPGVGRRLATVSEQCTGPVACRAVADLPTSAPRSSSAQDAEFLDPSRPVKVLIAGGGIAGLVLAVSLAKKGVDVQIFEQDMTAIRGEGKYRGPIQVQSNALAALEAIDPQMAAEIMAEGCITGDRINGLCDGVSGDWYVKFDTFHPAVDNGMPVTRVISRITLQQILAKYLFAIKGEGSITPDTKVVSFSEDKIEGHPRVWAEMPDGTRDWGDVLIGADGIWSRVREQLIGHTSASYSGYTCYTGISDFVCADIDTVAYRVFLGNGQYFVSSDVGGGKMQWYAFYEEPAGGKDEAGKSKGRLMSIFGKWNDMVTDLIAATPEDDIIRRDIYDRAPIFKWTEGRVALLGDSAHAMQPNLGQGGCMAIEDSYELANIIGSAMESHRASEGESGVAFALPFTQLLQRYQNERVVRASAIHGMARMAAIAASTYKAFLGEDFHLEDKFKIPHPGRVAGQLVLKATMPMVLGWVLGGNTRKIEVKDRAQYCSLEDRPHGFALEDWDTLLADDEALLKASNADWVLVPMSDDKVTTSVVALEDHVAVGRKASSDILLQVDTVSEQHAEFLTEDGVYYIMDLGSENGTWLNGKQLVPQRQMQLHPGDFVSFCGKASPGLTFKVKLMHVSQRAAGLLSSNKDGSANRFEVSYREQRAKVAE